MSAPMRMKVHGIHRTSEPGSRPFWAVITLEAVEHNGLWVWDRADVPVRFYDPNVRDDSVAFYAHFTNDYDYDEARQYKPRYTPTGELIPSELPGAVALRKFRLRDHVGRRLTPAELWVHSDGREGEAPLPAEIDWRPMEAVPEDFA